MEQSQNLNRECYDYLFANLTDSIDRLRHTYKAHEKAADRHQRYESVRRWALIILTMLATGSFVASLFVMVEREAVGSVITGAVASLAALAAFLGDVLDYPRQIREHHASGTKVRSLFVRYEALLSDYLAGATSASSCRALRYELQHESDQLFLDIPRTTRRDYEKAQKAIESDERTSSSQDALLESSDNPMLIRG